MTWLQRGVEFGSYRSSFMGTSTYSTSATNFSLPPPYASHFNLPLLPPNSLHFSPAASFPPPPPLHTYPPTLVLLFTKSFLSKLNSARPSRKCLTSSNSPLLHNTYPVIIAHLMPLYIYKEPVHPVLSLNRNLTPS